LFDNVTGLLSCCLPALVLIFLVIIFGCGCGASGPSAKSNLFDDIYHNIGSYADSTLTLEGQFMGWTGTECRFPPYASRQLTRSDWSFKVGGVCLYVTGGHPVGLDLFIDTLAGREMHLEATVRCTHDNKIYLEYKNGVLIH